MNLPFSKKIKRMDRALDYITNRYLYISTTERWTGHRQYKNNIKISFLKINMVHHIFITTLSLSSQ